MLRLVRFYHARVVRLVHAVPRRRQWMHRIVDRIAIGGGRPDDLELITSLGKNIEGKSHCALGDALVWPITSAMKKFPEDFALALERGKKLLREPATV